MYKTIYNVRVYDHKLASDKMNNSVIGSYTDFETAKNAFIAVAKAAVGKSFNRANIISRDVCGTPSFSYVIAPLGCPDLRGVDMIADGWISDSGCEPGFVRIYPDSISRSFLVPESEISEYVNG